MKEVKKMAKSVEPEAALGKPGKYTGNDLKSHDHETHGEPKPTGESNHEALGQGRKGKKESVKQVSHDQAQLAKARKYAARSEHGGAEENAVAGK
jgi:hypothetical protein